eukprot:m51a1_g4612 hypothetical protein (1001) ;mRNA; f:264541-268206
MIKTEEPEGAAQGSVRELEAVEIPVAKSPQAPALAQAAQASALSRWLSLIGFLLGFYGSYLLVGITQESIYTMKFEDRKFKSPEFLVFMVFFTNALTSYIVMKIKGLAIVPVAPLRYFAFLALAYGGSLWLANRSMLYLDYPTQTLFKSCKPLPVFLTGLICFRQGYSAKRGIPVLFVCAGLVGFTYCKILADRGSFSGKGTGWTGIALVCTALVVDGATGYYQDLICKGFYSDKVGKALAPWHLMLFVNIWSASYAFAGEVVSGELPDVVSFVLRNQTLLWYIVAFSLCSALGQLAVYYVVAKYDSLTCSIAAALRKFLVIVLSIFWFRHSVSLPQWFWIFVVFTGISFEVLFAKSKDKCTADKKDDDVDVASEREPSSPRSPSSKRFRIEPFVSKSCIVWARILLVSVVLLAQVISFLFFMPLSADKLVPANAAHTIVGRSLPVSEARLFVWAVPDQPPPAAMRQTIAIEAAKATAPGTVRVFCASSSCLAFASSFGDVVSAERLKLSDYVNSHSPLEPWIRRVSPLKFHLGSERFKNALQAAVEAAVLYEYGGTLVSAWGGTSPGFSVPARPKDADPGALLCVDVGDGARIAYAAGPRDAALAEGMRLFDQAFPLYQSERTGLAYPNLRPSCSAVPLAPAARLSADVEVREGAPAFVDPTPGWQRKYGAIWYDLRVNKVLKHTLLANLGDEVQSMAGAQWVPRIDTLVERDDLNVSTPSINGEPPGSVTMFMNAWWGVPDMNWPPPESIKPVLVSMHIISALHANFSQQSWRDYMVRHGPVGARDLSTLELWQKLGLKTFHSRCMTLTLQRPLARDELSPECPILISDVARSALSVIPKHVRRSACHITANARNVSDGRVRVTKAFLNLRAIAAAKLVITSRLHVALPAVAMGTPAILILTEEMPGGGGKGEKFAYSRFSGFLELMHVYEKKRNTPNALFDFDWENPPPNPGARELQFIRCQFLRHVHTYNNEIFDSMLFFDVNHIFDACRKEYPGL